MTMTLILCESADGWSLHEPTATDDMIAVGDAPYLRCGSGEPKPADYRAAEGIMEIPVGSRVISDDDTGVVLDSTRDADQVPCTMSVPCVYVGWASGVKTWAATSDLSVA